jgi:ketosteroid isomerase-like protein
MNESDAKMAKMEPQEVVQAFYAELNNSGPEAAADYLAEDYAVEQPGAPVQSKAHWLALWRMWQDGFSDIAIKYDLHSVDGNLVRGRSRVTATHTGALDLGQLGMGVVAATGKSVTTVSAIGFIVEDGKIVSGTAKPEAGGGIPGLLAQLGVEMP